MPLFARRQISRQQKVAPANNIRQLAPAGSETEWIDHAKPLFWLAAWSLVLLSMIVNARNASTFEALVLGICFDVLGPAAIAVMFRARVERMALICLAFAACSVVWSLANAFGTASHGTFGAERSAADAARAQQEHAAAVRKAKTELAALPSARPPVAVQAAIGAILADPRSDNCEDLNGPYTRKHCPDLVPLRKELGVAKARQSLSSRLAELRKVDAQHRSVSEVEPYIEGAVRLGRQLGIEVEPDNVRLVRLALFVVLLEFGKVFGVGFVAWLTSRPPSAAALPDPGPSGAIPAPPEPGPKKACPEPASWLLEAFHGGGDLPTGIERRNGGLQGSYAAFAAAWGTSTAKAQRLGRQWQESGEFTVRTGRRGTWIGPLPRRLHAV